MTKEESFKRGLRELLKKCNEQIQVEVDNRVVIESSVGEQWLSYYDIDVDSEEENDDNLMFNKENLKAITKDYSYLVGVDFTGEDSQFHYTLSRANEKGIEILLTKTKTISSPEDKGEFQSEVNNISKYFNCKILEI